MFDDETAKRLKAELEELEKEETEKKTIELIEGMSARDFLIGRTKETIKVPIPGFGGEKNIEIRARLSKSELKNHAEFLNKWKNIIETNEIQEWTEDEEKSIARFLDLICIDPSLNYDFWISDEIAPEIANELLTQYFIVEPVKRMAAVSSFLTKQLRTASISNAPGMASDSA